jgi:hypothetical protein
LADRELRQPPHQSAEAQWHQKVATEIIMTDFRSKSRLRLTAAALIAAPLVFGATAAMARVNVGIDVGIPGVFVPPVVVAPPVVEAPPPVVYAPPAVYAAPPAVVVAPGPVVVGGGYWWTDSYGHRYWRRR